jgi:hypothetical protein
MLPLMARLLQSPYFQLALLVLVVFYAVPGGSFHLDDYSLFEGPGSLVRPLTQLSFWLNGTGYLEGRGQQAAWVFLLVNVLLHFANSCLVFAVLSRLMDRRVATVAAMFFAVHPLQAEAVSYVFARATLLAALFCLLTLRAWLDDRPWLACCLFAAAVLSKEDALALPLVLAVIERRASRPLVVTFAIAAAAGAWSVWAVVMTPGSGAGTQAGIAPLDYLAAQGAVIGRYLRLLVFPVGLTLDPEVSTAYGWLGWVILLAAVAAVARFRAGQLAIAGLLLLLPSSSIVPLQDLSADRRMYLPLAALSGLAALALARVQPRWSAGVLVLVLVLGAVCAKQVGHWQTEESLWRHVTTESPRQLRPQIQLARAVEPGECLRLLEPWEQRLPDEYAIPAEMGRCALQMGDAPRALRHFGRALALRPNDVAAKQNRDAALKALGIAVR